jgi:hypothetical protein
VRILIASESGDPSITSDSLQVPSSIPSSFTPGDDAEFSYGKLDITSDEPVSVEDALLLKEQRRRREIRDALHGLRRGLGWWLGLGLIRGGAQLSPSGSRRPAGDSLFALSYAALGVWVLVFLWRTRRKAREEWTWVGLGVICSTGLVSVGVGLYLISAFKSGIGSAAGLLAVAVFLAIGITFLRLGFSLPAV